MDRSQGAVDVKRIVAVVLLGSTLGMVFFLFYFLLGTLDDEEAIDAPPGWIGHSYSGLVVDITDDSLTLHTLNRENLVFKLEPATRYVLRGNTPVKRGVEVKVLFRAVRGPEGTTMVARTVRVLNTGIEATRKPVPSPSTSPGVRPSRGPTATPEGENPLPSPRPGATVPSTPSR